MSAGANLFMCSCAILAFAIINLNVGPNVNSKLKSESILLNCKNLSDHLDYMVETYPSTTKEWIEEQEKTIRECRNRRAMYDMEYTSFIFNAAIGFICTLLGLFGLQKEVIKKSGIVGMALGVIGFVLTLVYVIYNGVVYTNYYDTEIPKRDGEGAIAELVSEGNYRCLFFNKENDTDALYAKYSDLIKSQYNFDIDLIKSFDSEEHPEKGRCVITEDDYINNCKKSEIWETYAVYNGQPCAKLYYTSYSLDRPYTDDSNYDKSARFLTVLIFSILIILCHLGLIGSGLMMMKEA